MEHFAIVQALCRAALSGSTDAAIRQVERLRDALASEGETKNAQYLTRLLNRQKNTQEIRPSKLVQSKNAPIGLETLTENVPMPVDKESSTPLATVYFPVDGAFAPPVFEGRFDNAVATLTAEWRNADKLMEAGITPSRSCLIYGPPGTGKTHLAFWIAQELKLPLVLAQLHGLMSSFLGTTSRNINSLFRFANRYRCVLLLDEFDAIAKLRDDPQEVGEIKRVVNALLQNLDTRNALGTTVGITNHDNLLDPAIWRRFDYQLAIPKPSFPTRLQMAREYSGPLCLSEPQLKLLAWLADGTTGAEIKNLVEAVKRDSVIRDDVETELVPVLQRLATVNSGRFDESKKRTLFEEPAKLANALLQDTDLQVDQSDVAEILGCSRATVSRWLSKERAKDQQEVTENG